MAMVLLQQGFDERLGPGEVVVRSLGFGPEDQPAIDDAVDAMAARGLDLRDHRSRQVTGPRVAPADLVLTAEHDHVIRVADATPEAFGHTFTIPEFVQLAARREPGRSGFTSVREWAELLGGDRDPAVYFGADVAEVWDPTGSSRRRFARAVDELAALCDAVVRHVAAAKRSGDDTDAIALWSFDEQDPQPDGRDDHVSASSTEDHTVLWPEVPDRPADADHPGDGWAGTSRNRLDERVVWDFDGI